MASYLCRADAALTESSPAFHQLLHSSTLYKQQKNITFLIRNINKCMKFCASSCMKKKTKNSAPCFALKKKREKIFIKHSISNRRQVEQNKYDRIQRPAKTTCLKNLKAYVGLGYHVVNVSLQL